MALRSVRNAVQCTSALARFLTAHASQIWLTAPWADPRMLSLATPASPSREPAPLIVYRGVVNTCDCLYMLLPDGDGDIGARMGNGAK